LHLNLPILTTDIPLSKYLIYGRKDQGFLVNLHQIVRIHADRSEYKMYFLITKVVKYSSITGVLFVLGRSRMTESDILAQFLDEKLIILRVQCIPAHKKGLLVWSSPL